MSLHALVEKWRESARGGSNYSTTEYEDGCTAALRRCADELESALAGGGEAVAWMDHMGGVITAAMKNRDHGLPYSIPLFAHPAGAAQVDDEMVELALEVFSGGLQNYYPSGYCTGNRESMRAALEAALKDTGR